MTASALHSAVPSRRHIEHTVFGIELVDRRAATHRIAFAEDLLNVAVKQFVDTVIHDISPWLLTVAQPQSRCEQSAQIWACPPSTKSSVPAMKLASEEARKTAAPAKPVAERE